MRKYKITVLTDLERDAGATLKSAIGLAKIIDGEIEVFSVKKTSEIVHSENQLSAMRSINSGHNSFRKKMKNLIAPISEQYDIRIDSSFSIGNIKGEIGQYIDTKKPDIIVLGKRREKVLKFVGDSIIPFVLNKFKGVILIANNNSVIEPNKEIVLGMFNNLGADFNLDFAEDLIEYSHQPLISFKIAQNSDVSEGSNKPSNRKTIEYVFEQGDGAIRGISTYLVKNKIDVLYVDRFKRRNGKKINTLKSDINKIIDKLNVTLLLTGEERYNLQ